MCVVSSSSSSSSRGRWGCGVRKADLRWLDYILLSHNKKKKLNVVHCYLWVHCNGL